MHWWSNVPPGVVQHKLITGSLKDSAGGATRILLEKETLQTTWHPFLTTLHFRSR